MCRRRKTVIVIVDDEPVVTERPIIEAVCFFSEDGRKVLDKMRTIEAKVACHLCPVERECLEFALSARIEHGVWGGTLPDERAVMVAMRNGKPTSDVAIAV